MSDNDGGGGFSQCCFGLILTSGLTALSLWLSLRTSNPICSIQDMYVPALNKSANSSTTQIYFDLKLDNPSKDKGIYYDALNLTFYYAPNRSFPIGSVTYPKFYQGFGKNKRLKDWVNTRGVPWPEVVAAASNGSPVAFRVDLATAVRFKIVALKTKKHRLVVGADVEVNGVGKKVAKKGVRLKSFAPEPGCYRARVGPLVIAFTVLSFLFIF